jgi:transposase-like protein
MDKLFKRGIEKMLESELSEHLGYVKHSIEGYDSGNSRNGKTRKLVKSSSGEIIIEVPRDREGGFTPVVLPKRQKVIDKIESVVISLYARGMSTRDIEDQIKDIYGITLSASSISNITDQVISDVEAWQNRALDDSYLIACSDNLKGLTQAIKAVFPETVTQLCIVHQIRNTMNYIATKDKRVFMKDLQEVYQARNLDVAQEAFVLPETKWGEKYPYAIKSWIANWENLTAYFEYPLEIRKIIYTTNVIENLNRSIRKFTKNKLMFPDDQSMKKAVYLAIQQASNAWAVKVKNWPLIANQFLVLYPDRANINQISLKAK